MTHQNHNEKLEIAKRRGFKTVEAAYANLYGQYQSCSKVGEIFGMTGEAMRYQLKKIGVPLRGRGGNNRK